MVARRFAALAAVNLALALVYLLASKVGLSLAFAHTSVSPVWPPAGVALAALLRLGSSSYWPGIFLGAFLANGLLTPVSVGVALSIAVGNTLEAVVGAYLVHRFIGKGDPLGRYHDVLKFVLLAPGLSTMVSATIGTATLVMGGFAAVGAIPQIWFTWWLGDGAGIFVVGTLLISLPRLAKVERRPYLAMEAISLFGMSVLMAGIVFLGWFHPGTPHLMLSHLTVPMLIWAAVRFGQLGVAATSVLVNGMAIWGTLIGSGPFASGNTNQSLLLLQLFIVVVTATAQILAAAISERRRALLELAEAKQRVDERAIFQAEIIANMAEGVCLVSARDSRIVYANRKFEQIFGYEAGEMEGKLGPELLAPPGQRSPMETAKAIIAEPGELGHWQGEMLNVRKDGTPFWSRANVSAFEHPQYGTVWVDVHTDIDDQKRAEEALRKREKQLSEAQKIAHVGSWEWNIPTGTITWSDELFRIYGEEPQNFQPTFETFLARVHPEDRDMVLGTVEKSTRDRSPFDFENRILRPDGFVRWLKAQGEAVIDRDGNVVRLVGTGQDITEAKLAEEERRRREELERINQELEQFTYIASHDLQEPLRMMNLYAELLAKRFSSQMDTDSTEYTQFITDGARRMKRLIEDLLAYSRAGAPSVALGPMSSRSALCEAIAILKPAIEASEARIVYDSLPQVQGNPSNLMRVFQNLLANSIKFRAKGKTPEIRIEARQETGEWIFSVADNGIGFEAKYASDIFQPFHRLHPRSRYPGTGVGLASCKRMVERLGGKIWVESIPGKGTTFYFTIPAV